MLSCFDFFCSGAELADTELALKSQFSLRTEEQSQRIEADVNTSRSPSAEWYLFACFSISAPRAVTQGSSPRPSSPLLLLFLARARSRSSWLVHTALGCTRIHSWSGRVGGITGYSCPLIGCLSLRADHNKNVFQTRVNAVKAASTHTHTHVHIYMWMINNYY